MSLDWGDEPTFLKPSSQLGQAENLAAVNAEIEAIAVWIRTPEARELFWNDEDGFTELAKAIRARKR